MHASFTLSDQPFMAMDSGLDHDFTFNEAISFTIDCKSQDEVDYFWDKLIEGGGEPSQCGWLKDKFGLSWQVVPAVLIELLRDEDLEKSGRVMQAMLQMAKIDIAMLQAAHEGQ
jgi:predicted 3-demethylubiquinone-9 3-methyltransferase (glyoxalase superfamily)